MNFIIKLFLNAVAVIVSGWILKDGIHVESYGYAVVIAAVLAILNVSVKPILILFTLPATIFTLGLFLVFVNAIIIRIADWLIGSGFEVDGWGWAILFSLLLSLVNTILERLVTKNIPTQKEPTTKIYDQDGNRVV